MSSCVQTSGLIQEFLHNIQSWSEDYQHEDCRWRLFVSFLENFGFRESVKMMEVFCQRAADPWRYQATCKLYAELQK